MKATPNVVLGMSLFELLLNYFIYAYLLIMLGTFLMKCVSDLVLFYSVASRYFVSTTFFIGFRCACKTLDRSLRVAIADDNMVSTCDIYHNFVLEIFGVRFSIDFILIAMGDVCVIKGIDWLSWFGALIDYKKQLEMVRDPSV